MLPSFYRALLVAAVFCLPGGEGVAHAAIELEMQTSLDSGTTEILVGNAVPALVIETDDSWDVEIVDKSASSSTVYAAIFSSAFQLRTNSRWLRWTKQSIHKVSWIGSIDSVPISQEAFQLP